MRSTPLVILLPLALLHGRPAGAQTPKPVSVSFGVFLPADSDTRARTTNSLLIADVRYVLSAKAAATSRTLLGVSAAHSSRGEGSTVVSGTVGQSYSLTGAHSPLAAQAGYAGFGVGVYGMDLNGTRAFARPGAYAEAGYNVTETFFVNTQYRLVDRAGGTTLTLGVRF